jgi:hypothetical protein
LAGCCCCISLFGKNTLGIVSFVILHLGKKPLIFRRWVLSKTKAKDLEEMKKSGENVQAELADLRQIEHRCDPQFYAMESH